MWTLSPSQTFLTNHLECRVISPAQPNFKRDFQPALDLRMRVFVQEQNVPADQEADWIDTHPECVHFLCHLRRNPSSLEHENESVDSPPVLVGTLRVFPFRLHPDEDIADAGAVHDSSQTVLLKLGRFAVDAKCRGRGFGRQMVHAVDQFLAQQSSLIGDTMVRVWIHAQLDKRGFYERCGFLIDENKPEPFLEDGIVHCRMFRDCNRQV